MIEYIKTLVCPHLTPQNENIQNPAMKPYHQNLLYKRKHNMMSTFQREVAEKARQLPSTTKKGSRTIAPDAHPTDAPPSYFNIEPSADDIAKTVRAWDKQRPRRKPGRIHQNMTFRFVPEIRQDFSLSRFFRNRNKQPSWVAILCIESDNVARMMRDGFHWSAADIQRDNGHLVLNDSRALGTYGMSPRWRHVRTWYVRDSSKNSQWRGSLRIIGTSKDTVINFDPNQITPDMVVRARAWNWTGGMVYEADKKAGHVFNTVFNSMPLTGWWPAPKKEGDQLKGWKQ